MISGIFDEAGKWKCIKSSLAGFTPLYQSNAFSQELDGHSDEFSPMYREIVELLSHEFDTSLKRIASNIELDFVIPQQLVTLVQFVQWLLDRSRTTSEEMFSQTTFGSSHQGVVRMGRV